MPTGSLFTNELLRRPIIRTGRVNQLDADLLDHELHYMLAEPLWTALTPIVGPTWRPELMAILKLVILRLSLKQSGSYGAKLQNLKWLQAGSQKPLTRAQITAYSILAVAPSYLRTRLRDYMLSSGWADCPSKPNWRSLITLSAENRTRRNRYLKRTIWDLSERLEQIYSSLELLNFLAFLLNGRYRSLLERCLGIAFVYSRLDVRRNVSFEFLNRQLVWESITDFVLFFLPLVDFKRVRLRLLDGQARLKDWVNQVFSDDTQANSNHSPSSSKRIGDRPSERTGKFGQLSNELCPICVSKRVLQSRSAINSNVVDPNDPMTFPSSVTHGSSSSSNHSDNRVKIAYQVNCCQGLYCYYCLVSEMIIWRESHLDQRWMCWRCGKETSSIKRWNGGLLSPSPISAATPSPCQSSPIYNKNVL